MKKDPILYNYAFYGLLLTTPVFFIFKLMVLNIAPFEWIRVINIASTASFIVFFVQDRKQLKNDEKYYCPHWGWFFLAFVYIYKRVRHNGMSMGWFITYFVFSVLPMIISAIIIALAFWVA